MHLIITIPSYSSDGDTNDVGDKTGEEGKVEKDQMANSVLV